MSGAEDTIVCCQTQRIAALLGLEDPTRLREGAIKDI